MKALKFDDVPSRWTQKRVESTVCAVIIVVMCVAAAGWICYVNHRTMLSIRAENARFEASR